MQTVEGRKIYCANCLHCKITVVDASAGQNPSLKVRCAAGQWKKKVGEEKFYRYDTVEQRRVESCSRYEAMGDLEEFLKDLRQSLPSRDNAGSPVGASA
jgi:hypothetical protein